MIANRREYLRIPPSVCTAVLQHASAAFPREAVGFIAGRKNLSEISFPLTNIGSPGTFFVDPCSQFQAEMEIAAQHLQLLAIYHSHPDGCTCLSREDLFFASAWDCLHAVVSLGKGGEQIRAYRVIAERAIPVRIELDQQR